MNLTHLVLFIYGSSTMVAAERRYPSLLIINGVSGDYRPILPMLEKFSSNEEDRASAFHYDALDTRYYSVCPARPQDQLQQNINEISTTKNVLFYREQEEPPVFTDLPMTTCESPIRTAFQEDKKKTVKKGLMYEMVFEICLIHLEKNRTKVDWKHPEKNFTFYHMLNFNFDQTTKTTISVSYRISTTEAMLTASNKTDDIPFDQNLELLGTHVDRRYDDFRNRILPRMHREKSNNPLAYRLGVQKIQLAARDDFFTDALKTITYADVMTTPVWKSLLLKWNAVEIFIRKLAKGYSRVYTTNGISGMLNAVDNYYRKDDDQNKKLRISQYVWKMVCDQWYCDTAILIVMHNDPFNETKPDSLCPHSCAKYGWLIDNYDYRTGLIYCCELTAEVVNQFGINLPHRQPEVFDISNLDGFVNLNHVVSNPTKRLYDW